MPLSPESRPMARNSSSGLGALKARCGRSPASLNKCSSRTCRLQEQLKKFQEDVDFRFHDGAPAAPAAKPPQKRSETPEVQTFADDALGAPGASAPRGNPAGEMHSIHRKILPRRGPRVPWAARHRRRGRPQAACGATRPRHPTRNKMIPARPWTSPTGGLARPDELRQRLRPNQARRPRLSSQPRVAR